jgi:hypothetical protein
MAFYTATWFKQLVREDHANIQKYLNKEGNNLRRYIDSTLPFTLWLDIGNIRKNILKPEAKAIQELCALTKIQDPNIFINALDDAYVATINEYIETYPHIRSKDLAAKLDAFSLAIDTGGIKNSIETLFKRITVITELSKKNKSVLLIAPKFTTIQSKFGTRVKSHFNYDLFSDSKDKLGNSPKSLVKAYLDKNFGVLQNIGHIEIDVLSSKSGSSEVKRGLVSPRLLQALLEWPKDAKPELLARKFSKETGQAETRVIIRKKFSNSKLVLEMLIESGIMIGSLESQQENLKKARYEKAFKIGSALSRRLVEDKNLLLNLVTSKSIKQYVTESLLTTIKSGKNTPSYQSKSILTQKTPILVQKSELVAKTKNTNTNKLFVPISKQISGEESLVNLPKLLVLINSQLQDVISANMGDGNSRNVLNYRTGRFASTVKVSQLSESRSGMITAFYSYMKNPYSTFSPGPPVGRQSKPASRDPRLLISKSIREIAQQVVGNNLRASPL